MINFHQLQMLCMQEERILQYIGLYEEFFLYGAGKYGIILLNILREKGIEPAGFLVTDGKKSQDKVDGLPVYELKDLNKTEVGIILTVYYPLQQEMIERLKCHGINDYMILFK